MSQNIQSTQIQRPIILRPLRVNNENIGSRIFTQTPPPVLNMPINNLKFINPRLADMVHPQRDRLVEQFLQLSIQGSPPKIQKTHSITSPLKVVGSPHPQSVAPLNQVPEKKPPQKQQKFEYNNYQLTYNYLKDSDVLYKNYKIIKLQNRNHVGIESSRQIQESYERGNLEIKNSIFIQEIQKGGPDNIIELALDKYMHYVLEKVLDLGPLSHKQWVYDAMLSHKEQLWDKKYAQKILSKCIETSKNVSRDHYLLFVDFILKNKDVQKRMRYHHQGNQIIQKCVEIFEDEHLMQLLSDLSQTIVPNELWEKQYMDERSRNQLFEAELCTNQYGCLIVNKLVDIQLQRVGKPKQIITKIIDRIISRSVDLSLRQYSNYVVQQVLEKVSKEQRNSLLNEHLIPDFVILAQNKYGSNVAEKVVEYSLLTQLETLYTTQIQENLGLLVNDSYANYVMQKFYKCAQSSPNLKNTFLSAMFDLDMNRQLQQNGQIVLRFMNQSDQPQYQNGHSTNQYNNYKGNQTNHYNNNKGQQSYYGNQQPQFNSHPQQVYFGQTHHTQTQYNYQPQHYQQFQQQMYVQQPYYQNQYNTFQNGGQNGKQG